MSGIIQAAQTASQTVAANQEGVFATGYGYYPNEGSRVVTAQYNWAAQLGFIEDLSQLEARGVETTIQSIYVDNSDVPTAVTITIAGSNEVIKVPGGWQGVFPCFFSGTPGFQIVTTALVNAATRVYLLNMPISPASWAADGGNSQIPAITPAAPTVSAAGVTSLVLKAAPTAAQGGVKYFHAENASAVAGYAVLYNATAAPAPGALTPALVLAFQFLPASGYADWSAASNPIAASVGAVVLLTSAANPFTYTTGAITGAIYGLAQ